MSSLFGFNMPMFYVGAFLSGCGQDVTTVQSYASWISDDDEVQKRLLSNIGKVILFEGVLNSFLLPPIYEIAGFQVFCGSMCLLQVLAIITLCILWYHIAHRDGAADAQEGASRTNVPKPSKLCLQK